MSSSEKLKALGPPFDLTETHSWVEVEGTMREINSMAALYDALPQIVAVTSAAEAADDAFENYRNAPDGELSDYAVEEVMAKLVNQRIALSALEEALS